MRKLRHPLSGAIYEVADDGNVRVEARDGRVGEFTGDGVWLAGELRSADPELCRWIRSGTDPNPRLRTSRRYTALMGKIGSQS